MKKTLGWIVAFFVVFTILMLGGKTAMDIAVWFTLIMLALCAVMFVLGALIWIGKATRAVGQVIDRNDPQSPNYQGGQHRWLRRGGKRASSESTARHAQVAGYAPDGMRCLSGDEAH